MLLQKSLINLETGVVIVFSFDASFINQNLCFCSKLKYNTSFIN